MEATPSGPLRITRLVLSKGGKRLLRFFLVVGALVFAGVITAAIINANSSSTAQRHLNDYYTQIGEASARFGAKVQSCALSSGGPDCVHGADRQLAHDMRTFRDQIDREAWPAIALAKVGENDGVRPYCSRE